LLCTVFNPDAIFFSIINVFIACYTVFITGRSTFRKKLTVAGFILVTGIGSGIISAFIQLNVIDHMQNEAMADIVETFTLLSGHVTYTILSIILNIFDKALSTGAALLIISILPEATKNRIKNLGLKQKLLSDDELKLIKKRGGEAHTSVRTRMSLVMVGISVSLVFIMGAICVQLYFNYVKDERRQVAQSAVRFAAQVVDGNRIDEYLRNGVQSPGYMETRQTLERIRDSALGVKYLYILRVERDGCYFVFDLDSEDEEAYLPGEKAELEEAFLPYLDDLLAGRAIEPIESDDLSGWVLTVYEPVRNDRGETVAYAGADVSLEYTTTYINSFIVKVVFIMAGFFVFAIAFGIWITGVYTAFPIGSITSCVDRFAKSGDDQEVLDDNVRKIRALGIQTGDEIERLYQAICKMTLQQAEQVREIRHYTDSTSKMQDGLIITMADMVESRDSDTGAHVQKTAAYVKIIAEGLKKKGYYAEKITDKYIADCVRSAPLHDVGKINIPDNVLNKPGKLTDEEFAIMKTHASAGRKIIEKAISTVHGESYLKEARNMAGYHHERWDGKGYPENLHGEVIPLSARIMAVADVFDALTSPRVYKPAFPLDKALSIIKEGAGSQFDPKCVEVFMENLTEVKVILKKYNNQDV
nr:HD domain-containing protein [Lachnospiraceae bacterium]